MFKGNNKDTNGVSKSNKYERDWSRLDRENFILDYFSVDWDKVLLPSNMKIGVLYKIFLEKFESA